jgi:hypothetical protein
MKIERTPSSKQLESTTAVAVLDDPAYLEYLAEPLPQPAPAETVIVKKTKTVRGKSSRTPSGTAKFTDPINMTDDELADMVAEGYRQFYRYIPYIITLWQRFQKKERDGKNRLLEPIKGCHSFDEFCTKFLDRTPSAVYKAIRQVMQPELTDSTDKPKPKPKPTAKSKLGSASYVNEDHPDRERMQAAGLINDEASETEFRVRDDVGLPKEEAPEQPAEKIVIKRRDGSIIPEAAASVEEIVRTNLGFILSSHRFLNDEEKVQAIDQLIAKLKSERDFIISVIDVGPMTPQSPVSTDVAKTLTEPSEPTTVQTEPGSEPLCLTCPRCGNQEGIQAVVRNVGQAVRRYHCTKCDLKTGCNSFTPKTGPPMEAAEVRA